MTKNASINPNIPIMYLYFELFSRIITGKKNTDLHDELENYTNLKGINTNLMSQRENMLAAINYEATETPDQTLKYLCLTTFLGVINDANDNYRKTLIKCHEHAIKSYDKRFLKNVKEARYALKDLVSVLHLETASAIVQMDKDLFGDQHQVVNNYIQNVHREYPHFSPVIKPQTVSPVHKTSPQHHISHAHYVNTLEAGPQ